jgi:hypothetical protein
MNVTLADVVANPSNLYHVGRLLGAAAYQVGTLALATCAGAAVVTCLSKEDSDAVAGIAAGVFTGMCVYALTNPFTPLKDIFIYAAASFATVTALYIVAMAAVAGAMIGAIIGVTAAIASCCTCGTVDVAIT